MDIAVLGLGNVGTKTLQIIEERNAYFKEKFGLSIKVTCVSDSKHTIYNENGLDIKKILRYKMNGNISEAGYESIKQEEMFDLKSNVIVDLSPATEDGIFGRDLYISAFEKGKDVVTANKAPLALHWNPIMETAKKCHRKILFETTVAGGVPLFNLRNFSLAPSQVLSFRGIVSSTVNFVLKEMISGGSFDEAVRMAQEMGIAEAKYKDDTMGIDAARKTVILANSLFDVGLTLNDIFYEGVEGQDAKIAQFAEEGGIYKVVSDISRVEGKLSVQSKIEKIEDSDPLRVLKETSLGYVMGTDKNGDVLVAGFHDGPLETASGVVNDILLLGRTNV